MLEIIQKGGPIMWLLAAISVIGTIIFLIKLLHFHRAQINSRDFLDGIYNVLNRGNLVEAVSICEETPGPVSHIVRAGLLASDDEPEELSRAIQHAGLTEVPRLEQNLIMLATLAKIAPMIGLLGTVIGMVETLLALQNAAPLAHSGDMAGGLYQALLTTAAGLAIAIPFFTAYNFLIGRISSLLLDMESASSEIFAFLSRRKRTEEGRLERV